jgi:predicted Zn-dependent peptidase
MKQVIVLGVGLLVLLGITVRVMAQEAVTTLAEQDDPFPLHRFELSNGLQVWCQPRRDSESVAALLVVPVGARHENPGNNGISHYVEHMLFTGTERWTEEEIKEIIDRRGGRWNGFASLERTTYFAHMSAQDVEIALDWLAEVVFHPTFPPDKIEKEREVIFQEKWGRYGWLINTLDELGFGYELERDVRRALFPGSTLGFRVIGEDDSLDNLDRDKLLAYYHEHYTPANAVLIVVGNFRIDEVLERVVVHFGNLKPAPPREKVRLEPPPFPAGGPQQVVVRGPLPTDQTRLMIGARTVERAHPDQWALEVLAEISEKALIEEIRYRKGLVYSLYAYNVFYNDAGYAAIVTVSEQDHRDAVIHEVEAYLAAVHKYGVTAEQVTEAQAALRGRWALSMEDNLARALWLTGWVSVLSDNQPVPDYPTAIAAVTPEDVQRVVRAYFIPQRRFQGLHQPIVTVARGARWAGGVVLLGFGVWFARKLWRWRQRGVMSDK